MFKKILSNTAYQVLGKMLTAIISIFLLNLLTNYLPIDLFWEYWKVYNYLLIFAFLADLWLYTISIREINKTPEKSEKIIWNILSLRVALWTIIIWISLLIASFIPSYSSTLTLLSILIVWVFTLFWLINSSILALMQANLKMQFSLFSSVFWKLINLLCIVAIIFLIFPKNTISENALSNWEFFWPFIAIMCAGLIWNIITTGMNYFYSKNIVNISFLWDTEYIKHIFITSLPYGIAIFLWVVYMKVDIILLSILESPDKANISIALYSVPMKVMEVFMLTGTFFLNSILPGLSKSFSENNDVEIHRTLKTSYIFLLSWSAIMLIFGFIFKDLMIEIIANSDYLNRDIYQYTSSDAFIIVLLMIVFYFMFLLFQYIFIAAEKQSDLLKINIAITLFNIIWNIILIPKYSFLGAWIITVLSQFLLMILAYFYSRKIVNFTIPKKETWLIILTSIFLYLIINFLYTTTASL